MVQTKLGLHGSSGRQATVRSASGLALVESGEDRTSVLQDLLADGDSVEGVCQVLWLLT